jgi:DNA-binding transcriptional regulator YdaS (Cro superfamily)
MKKHKEITLLKSWMRAATTAEQHKLANLISTTPGMLYQYSNGERQVSPVRAREMEMATALLAKANPTLPLLYRTDLASACAGCEFAKKCLAEKADRAEFPLAQQ